MALRFNGITYCNPPKGQRTSRAVTSRKDRGLLKFGLCKGTAEFRRQNICVQVSGMNRARAPEAILIDIISEIKVRR